MAEVRHYSSEKEFEDDFFDMLKTLNAANNLSRLNSIGLESINEFLETPMFLETSKTKISIRRQLRIDGYGIMDVFIHAEHTHLDGLGNETTEFVAIVIELKNEPIISENINQVCKYKRGIDRLNYYHFVYGILIGPDISTGDFICNNLNDEVKVFTYKMNMLGAEFDCIEDMAMTNEGTKDAFISLLNIQPMTENYDISDIF